MCDLTLISHTHTHPPYLISGGFLYIATVSILPTVLRGSGNDSVMQVIGEGSAFLVGVGFMVAVALLEGTEHGEHA